MPHGNGYRDGHDPVRVYDVIVAGGGPGGLSAAQLLASRGWDVALFEEHRSPGDPVHCTGVLAAEAYDELDIPREAILNTLSHVRFFGPNGTLVDYTTPKIEALVVDRRLFDHHLHVRAVKSGVTIATGARVTDIRPGPEGVTVSLASGKHIYGRACILACGASYVLQRRLGLGMPATFLQSAQVECPSTEFDRVEVHFGQAVAPRGFGWAVPVRRGEASFARLGVMCDGQPGRNLQHLIARIGERLGVPTQNAEGARLVPRLKMLPLAPIRKTYAERLVAIGDAAGLVKATTGGGIYYSLLSAAMAAEVLHDCLSRDALAEEDLRAYERAWRSRLGAELQAQLSLRLLANRLNDSEIDMLFDLAQTDGIMPIVRTTARFNQHRALILSLLKHPPARRIFFKRLSPWRQAATV